MPINMYQQIVNTMKTDRILKVVAAEQTSETWATDRPYVKPELVKPDFPIDSEQPKPISHVKRRIAEINAPKIEPVKKAWWKRRHSR